MPGTIASMGIEIRNQIEDLPQYADYLSGLRASSESEKVGRIPIFAGAGDSYAAALATEYLSKSSAKCLDPYEISRQPSTVAGSHLYLVSVSGRTRSNIEAAKASRKYARVTAITANRDSALARSSDEILELRFRSEGRLTPGTVSFTASLLACASRIQPLPKIPSLSGVYDQTLSWCDEIKIPINSTVFFVGTGLSYPLAIYGKAKIYEVLGSKAQSQRTEQFSHMELFSVTKDDLTIIIPEDESDFQARELHRTLQDRSFKTYLLSSGPGNELERCIETAIHLQVLAWKTAQNHGMHECAFINKSDILKINDRMIYMPQD